MLILCITVSTLIVVSVKKSDEGYKYPSSDSTTISGSTTFKSSGPFIIDGTNNKTMDIPADSLIEKIHLKINFDDLKDSAPQCYTYIIGAVWDTGQVYFTNELSYDEVSKGVFVNKLINTTTDKIVSVSWWSMGPYPNCSYIGNPGHPSGSLHSEVTYKNNK